MGPGGYNKDQGVRGHLGERTNFGEASDHFFFFFFFVSSFLYRSATYYKGKARWLEGNPHTINKSV